MSFAEQWGQFFDKINSDPDMQQALLNFGANMANSGDMSTAGAVSTSLAPVVQNYRSVKEQRTAAQKKAELEAAERAAKEETRQAELNNTKADTDLKGAQAEKARRPPVKNTGTPSDLSLAAAAAAKTDPKYKDQPDGEAMAFADLYKAKYGTKGLSVEALISDALSEAQKMDSLLGTETNTSDIIRKRMDDYDEYVRQVEARKPQEAGAEAAAKVTERVEAVGGKSTAPIREVTPADVMKHKPNWTPAQVRAALNDPAVVQWLQSQLAQTPEE